MAGTFTQLYYHIVFSTKERQDSISPTIETDLYKYIAGIIKNEECFLHAIGGTSNHIHILCSSPPKIALADLLKKIKGGSSTWLNKKFPAQNSFKWQAGYGAFSVSQSQVNIVKEYIKTQKEHHQKIDFKNELVSLLNKHKIQFNENYLWN
ncbi:MAG: IS200/IS605 family transposase [Lentisphaeraceae bacterium]|nr:IS200/IS605 family transposase [Lentisphaeraceae bacterium]